MDQVSAFVSAFIYIFVIINPFASLPVFITLTSRFSAKEMMHAAGDSVLIAGILAVIFLLSGDLLLQLLNVDISSFKIAGGVVLGLLGIETTLGLTFGKEHAHKTNTVSTLIATPILTGPGLITTLIVLSKEQGPAVPLIATFISLGFCWLLLTNSMAVKKAFGEQVIDVLTKIFGLFLVAMGVSFIRAGLGA